MAPARFGLFPLRSPLLRESRLLSFPQGTEMFQFPWFPLPVLCVQTGVTLHDECRVSPFRHPRISAWSAAPRGFSQPPTSFIGSRRQGIHRWLFVAWKNKDARACSAVLKGRAAGPHIRHVRRTGHSAGSGSELRAIAEGHDPVGSAPSKRKRRQSSSSRRAKRNESYD